MLRQRKISHRGRRHAAQDTPEHREDKAQAAHRRATEWVPVGTGEVAESRPTVTAPREGIQFIVEDGTVMACDAAKYIAHLDAAASARAWYWGSMRRKGKDCVVKRKRPDSVEQIAASLAPWQSDVLRAAAVDPAKQFDSYLTDFYKNSAERLAKKLTAQTGRDVLGVSGHLDSSVDHFHVQFSRVSRGNLLLGEHRGLHTAGGWMAGIKRQIDAGAVPEDSEKYRIYERNLKAFADRNQGELPLEIALNNEVDAEFERHFGTTQLARDYRENYAREVRERESLTLEMEAEDLERRAAVIREEIALRQADIEPPMIPIKRLSPPSVSSPKI